MKPDSKPARAASEAMAADSENTIAVVAGLMQRSIERLANLQKATLDIVGHQAADVNHSLRDTFTGVTIAPVLTVIDFTQQGVEGWINAQKNALDVFVQQSAHFIEVAKERTRSASRSVATLNEIVQQSAERTAAAQKSMIDLAEKETKGAAEATRRAS